MRVLRQARETHGGVGEGILSGKLQVISGKLQVASCKLKVESGKWQVGEPDDDTNFGSHANPGIGSHFGQTKFLVIYPASLAKIRKNKKP